MAVSEYVFKKMFESDLPLVEGARIDRILKINDKNIAFVLFSNHKSHVALLSLTPTLPLFLIGDGLVSFVEESFGFILTLKKYLEYGVIVSFEKVENDRIYLMHIRKRLPTYVYQNTTLVFEMIPMRANLILLDEENKIIDAFHKSEGFEGNHVIAKGLKYEIEPQNDKSIKETDSLEDLRFKVSRKESSYLASLDEKAYLKALKNINQGEYFYYSNQDISLLPLENTKKVKKEELFELILKSYEKEGKEQKFGKLIHFINNKCLSLSKKKSKLEMDLAKCEASFPYIEYGNLLFYGSPSYKRGDTSVEIEGVTIPLKKDKDLKENAADYFKRYKKAKSGVLQLKIQIEKTEVELSYFEELKTQCVFASPSDYQEIYTQLVKDNYLKGENKHSKKKKEVKVFEPHVINHQGVKIAYGLSSFQNDYLTFTLAHKDDLFLHVKDSHGPHVIVFGEYNDEALLFASEIALYFASLQVGEVYYTQRKNVKKIPSKTGLVEISSYKTIYINKIREESIKIFESISR